jgi:tetratricopeptide (TPR) repeat protein
VLAVPYTPPDRQDDLLLRARQATQRSLSINPGEGHALTAATYLQPTYRHWAAKERLHRLAIARSDKGSPAPIIHYGRFLTSVGRTGDAIEQIEEAMRIHPLVPWLNVSWIELLQVNDRLEEAENAAERAASLWPRNHDLWVTRFFLKAFNNDVPGAVAMVDDRAAWPEDVRPGDMALLRRAALAIQSGSATEADAVLADYERLAGEGQAYSEQAMRIAARLGRPDAAYRFADGLYAERGAPATSKRFASHDEYGWRGERATAPLFLYPAQRLWVDPRFMALAERIGLVDYWRGNGAPDVCAAVAETCQRYRLVPAAPTA